MNKIQFAEEISKRGLCFYFISIYLILTTGKENVLFSLEFLSKNLHAICNITLKLCFSTTVGLQVVNWITFKSYYIFN